jgi:predicted dehydrogenase/threonine dehydrogenase-like Zn-dependent dehydrogenase
MKQLLQRYDTGEMRIAEVPLARAGGGRLLVEARASLISAGTERAMLEFSRASLLEKARRQPDKVRQVIEKLRTDGAGPTLASVRARLGQPVTLGYCSAGVVVSAGPAVRDFAAGDRVVTNGPHGEYVSVPQTLAARIPDGLDFETAAFTPLAAIALQGIRLVRPTLGETVVVYGLGLVGLLSVQILRAAGCRVIGIDPDVDRLALAAGFGALPIEASGGAAPRVLAETQGIGADAVLLTLASDSDEPVHDAAGMSRKRGRIVLVGVAGLRLRRDDFYRKELSFQVSCSYGPGRYDASYEEEGHDYPIGFVRWTEQRNFEAVLQLMTEGRLVVAPLITHRFSFDDVLAAYDLVTGTQPSLGVVLGYPDRGAAIDAAARTVRLAGTGRTPSSSTEADRTAAAVVAVIGAGGFAQRVLVPTLKKAGFLLRTVASGRGTSATVAAERFGAEFATTDLDAVLADETIGTVFVATRHDSHARIALDALAAGKHVFVEKPLALNRGDLQSLEAAVAAAPGLLTVGFNRRFAPLSRTLRADISQRSGPLALIITVNAGAVPTDHWTRHPEQGGGRIAGEACHFIDLARALAGHPIVGHHAVAARTRAGQCIEDVVLLTLSFADGSTASIHYLANGSGAFPKERIEAFFDGRTIVLDNWRRLRRFGGRFDRPRTQDKGHLAELREWYRAVTLTGQPPIPYDEVFEVSRASLDLATAARQ